MNSRRCVQLSYVNEHKRVLEKLEIAQQKEAAIEEAYKKEAEYQRLEQLKKEKAKKRKASKENDTKSKKSLSKSKTFVQKPAVNSRLYQSNLSTRMKATTKFIDKENESRIAY